MMNYQYPAAYPTDAADPMLKIAPTPPPMLPSLDATDLEQTLYQRRVSDANDTESLQPLQIAYNPNQPPSAYNYPIIHQSAPVPKQTQSHALFSAAKPPQSAQVIIAQKIQSKAALTTPSTPPPPAQMNNNLSIKKQTERDIQSITPQSHANLSGNSASNHSANSSVHTTATTMIESVSNHSLHHQGVHSPHNGLKHAYIHKLSVPKLNNPLPPHPQQKQTTEGIVIPMDQQNYNALLQQMYPSQMVYPSHPQQYNPSAEKYNYSRSHYASDYYDNGSGYMYNTPPLPSNHGYYATNYYQQPNTAPIQYQKTEYAHYHQYQQQPGYAYHHASPHQPSSPKMEQISVSHTSPRSISKSTQRQNSNSLNSTVSPENMKVDYLQRCDGTIISPNADPLTVSVLCKKSQTDTEMDAFTAGDDALFGAQMVTIISVNWTTNIPFGTIRMHNSNRIHHVPLMDLSHIASTKPMNKEFEKLNVNVANNMNQRYRIGSNQKSEGGVSAIAQIAETTVIRRNPKLSDETLMKLPHLRKHREYIRSIDVNMGPKDYNSYRVSVNSKNCDDEETNLQNMVDSNGRTANIQNLNAKAPLNLNRDLNAGNKRKNKRMNACEKGDLFKTELCENWVKKGHCTYGKKCHFAHGRDDIRTRWRIENYKTQPCCDPARSDSRLCLFGKRCNYAHPGEPLRRSHHCLYLDEEYTAEINKDYGNVTPYPFGIYI